MYQSVHSHKKSTNAIVWQSSLFRLPLSETGYTKWQIGQPDHNRDNEHCGSCYRDGLLNDLPCDEPFSFVCEKAYATKNWPDGLCPTVCDIHHEGYDVLKGTKCESYELGYKKNTVNENKYYKLHLEGKNWDEALLSCLAEDANLAVITSDAEADMYAAELALYPANSIPGDFVKDVASIGFYDRLPSGNYTTVNGVPLSETGFVKWAPNQPDNTSGAEHCGSIYRSGLLNDIRCDAKFSFFCEKITEDKCMLPTQTLPLPL